MRICPTYNFLVLSLLAVAVTAGCSPLSKAQIEAVGELTFRSDTVSRSPAILFEEMSELRLERGLYYAASLSSGTARYEEVTALAEASMDDEALVRKAAGYVNVFNSYVRALHSVSSEARWTGIGTEIRGIGSRVDSVLYRYNRLDTGYEDIPVGYARMAGRVLAYVAEEVMQSVQGTAVRNIVMAGDTLVAASCDSLMDILRSDGMNGLIRHEQESLRDNYSAYLQALRHWSCGVSRSRWTVTAGMWNCSAARMNSLRSATAASRPCARSRTHMPNSPQTSQPERRKSLKSCGKRC